MEIDHVIAYAKELVDQGFPLSYQWLHEHVNEICCTRLEDGFPEVEKQWTHCFVVEHATCLKVSWSHALDSKCGWAVNPHTHEAWLTFFNVSIKSSTSIKNVSLLLTRLASHLIQEIVNELSEEGNLVPVKTQVRLLAESPEAWSLLRRGTWPQLMCCALVAVRVPEVGRGRVGVLEQGGSSDSDQDSERRREQTWGVGNERDSSQTGRRMSNTMRRVSKLTGVSLSRYSN